MINGTISPPFCLPRKFMKKRSFYAYAIILTVLIIAGSIPVCAQEMRTMQLPPPKKEGGKPLLQVLNERQSVREFAADKLSPQVLSNLLWAAWGTSRGADKRTAPS